MNYEYELFDFEKLEEVVAHDVHISMHLYIAAERKRKLKHFTS